MTRLPTLAALALLAFLAPAAASAGELEALWAAPIYDLAPLEIGQRELGTPAFVAKDQILIVGDRFGGLHAFDAHAGRVLWHREMGESLTAPAVPLDDETFVLAGGDGTLRVLRARDGGEVWSEPLHSQGTFHSPPVVHGPLIFAQDSANRVLAVTRAGRFIFDVGVRAPAEFTLFGEATPTTDGARLVVGFSDGTVAALDPIRGQRMWEATLPSEVARAQDAQAGPVIRKGRVYVGSPQGGLAVLSAQTGERLGLMKLPGLLYLVPAPSGELYALTWGGVVARLELGEAVLPKPAWSTRVHGVPGRPALTAHTILSCTGKALAMLDRATGAVQQWRAMAQGCVGGVATARGHAAHLTERGLVVVWRVLNK